ncbi:hypothetical protein LTR70_002456 [Exophiala xenobiotica]|uniref:J domain-containing protein n=1 Tax=Lithohypha guttulata TaxID=1690604 RepID=A0ABR0KJT7_9EURO|nr:hypothetical protein LTR24_001674 [Lithohypha guttulata]KAK5325291.1 hypothetical protein LTR70_002456 [Exophiala xenobiotica]
MSTSPLPPDPYEALGVSKDADSDAVKKAHRKLVLKHHPDRIKNPALVEQGKNEFQKVQQAYELLIDPTKRQRYDDQVKLAQLRRERMMDERMSGREVPRPTYTRTTYAARPSPAPTQPMPRETPRYAFEERAPDSYFDRMYEEPLPRANARKDPYEKRPSVSKPVDRKKEERRSAGWDGPAAGLSAKMTSGLKEKAQSVKQKMDKIKQQEVRARDAKARTKDERSARNEKNTHARYASPQADDDYSSESSNGDTVVATPRGGPDPQPRSPRPMPHSYSPESMRARSPRPTAARTRSPESISRARSPRPMARERSPRPMAKPHPAAESQRRRRPSPQPSSIDEESDSGDEWRRRHQYADAYITQSRSEGRKTTARPPMHRQGSESVYWAAEAARDHRRSGSDSDRTRQGSSHRHPRRSMPSENAEPSRRPPLHPHTSAPVGVKAAARTLDREPPVTRSRQGSYDSRVPGHRRDLFGEVPPLQRTSSDPVPPKLMKRDTAPAKSSGLKETQTHQHDSGYGSSSTPHTPEMRGDSPPRPRETTAKYKVEKDGEENRARKMADDGGEIRKFLSPEDAQYPANNVNEEKRERRPSLSRDREARTNSPGPRKSSPEPRSRAGRPGMGDRRPGFSRAESSSRYEEQRPRKSTMERSPERPAYSCGVDPKTVKYSSRPTPNFTKYDSYRAEPSLHRTREGRKVAGY